MLLSKTAMPALLKKLAMDNLLEALEEAKQLQVWRKSDHPTMQTDDIWEEIKTLRSGKQIRKAKRTERFLNLLILDLWIAATYEENPWRGVSRRKLDYSINTREHKIFLTYKLFVPLLDDLLKLGYIELEKGKWLGIRTRIKATETLLNRCTAWDVAHVHRADDVPEETIILKDEEDKFIEYIDTNLTTMWRKHLAVINAKLEAASITVPGLKVDTSSKRLYRVFNDGSWLKGGRFYGGFWMGLKQRDVPMRQTIQIDGEWCCELDFKATHATMMYNKLGLEAPADCYAVPGFDRQTIKKAFLVLFNCEGRDATLNAMRHKKHIKNSQAVLTAIEAAHAEILPYFYQREIGLQLQQLDALVASEVMNSLYKSDIVCLPVHDSFIVQKVHEEELRKTMTKWWTYHFRFLPVIDKKY